MNLFDNIGTLLAVGKKAGAIRRRGRSAPDRSDSLQRRDRDRDRLPLRDRHRNQLYRKRGQASPSPQGPASQPLLPDCCSAWCSSSRRAGAIPNIATALALIVVASMMMMAVADIAWTDPEISIPGFLTTTAIPLTYRIANGNGYGLLTSLFL